ncbi:hypothetical protein [Macrococcus capreoli]|uniref:hypothetical protein n=1 Tax=Macrococcus capreoli TaxID=2982690 RepID=UPI0021D5DF1F|nr:hypothetical protein [Macrococcus sp. TMW 2.2395]MCU7558628.1 hypothetical protein [Macrococcus sp. TMW 2.2395]
MDEYDIKKAKAIKNLKYYLLFNFLFIVFNIAVIMLKPSYTFPENFFAIWPILGWGAPTLFRFLELRHYK